MARELWAKIYVNLRHHPKLIGRPDADFRLWVGLILHAKEHCPDCIVRDLTPADMRGSFGIKAPVRAVEAGLKYFVSKGMLVEAPGGFLIRDMPERQAKSGDTPEAHAERQRQYKLRVAGDVTALQEVTSPKRNVMTSPRVSPGDADVDLEKEEERTKEQKITARSAKKPPPAQDSPFVAFVRAEWRDFKNPAAFEERAHEAFPGIDPLAEARKARGWELADPTHTKRRHGKFFWNWLTTAQKRASQNGSRNGSPQLCPPNLHVDNDAHHVEPSGRKFL